MPRRPFALPGRATNLSQFEPLEFHPVYADACKIVLGLLDKPAFGASAEYLGQPHGHFRRDSALLVHQSDKVVRVTPSAAAALVMVNPKGSMH